MRPDLTQTTSARLNPSNLTAIGSTATGLRSTALRSRSIEESLEAVRAIAELSSERGAEVQERVDQARSMIESLPEPIGVTEIHALATH